MRAEILELNTRAGNQVLDRARDENVVSAADVGHARCDVNRDAAHVVLR